MRKKLMAVFMACIMMLSVVTTTAFTSFAANETVNKSVTVRFVDGETGQPLKVDFTIGQRSGNTVSNGFEKEISLTNCSTYTWNHQLTLQKRYCMIFGLTSFLLIMMILIVIVFSIYPGHQKKIWTEIPCAF